MLSIYSRRITKRITKEQRVLPQINFKTNKDNFADHHAPLHKRQHDGWAFKDLNTAGALSYWASQGAPEHKLLLGTPFYGRTFTLADPNQSKPGARSSGPGKGGEFTEEPGIRTQKIVKKSTLKNVTNRNNCFKASWPTAKSAA